jgi:hypothetical protein
MECERRLILEYSSAKEADPFCINQMSSKYISLINSDWHHILRNPKGSKDQALELLSPPPLEDELNEKYDELKNLIAS